MSSLVKKKNKERNAFIFDKVPNLKLEIQDFAVVFIHFKQYNAPFTP